MENEIIYNQDLKFDGNKLKMELIPVKLFIEIAKILTYGAKKYSANSWQKVEPFEDRYYAAAMRHLIAWRSGEQIDEESGELHLSHCICCLMFLLCKPLNSIEIDKK
jgi:hypothetical protein